MLEWIHWSEVYLGHDLAKFMKIKQALQENGIQVKTKTQNTRGRLTRDVISGAQPLVTNTGGMDSGETYQIFVRKERAEEAKRIVRQSELK